MIKYPIDMRAMTLVYFRESSRLRKDRGMTISLPHESAFEAAVVVATGLFGGDKHKASNPKAPTHKGIKTPGGLVEASNDAWHQVPYHDQIAHADAEAFDHDCGVKYDSSIGIGNLGESEVR